MLLRRVLSTIPATLSLSVFCSLGCSDDGPHRQVAVTPVESEPRGACSAVLRSYSGGSSTHYDECSDIQYSMSPPVFGDHYPTWAAYQTYNFPLPLGYLVTT